MSKYVSRYVSMNPWQTAPKTVPNSANNTLESESISLNEESDDLEDEDESDVVEDLQKEDPTNLGNLQIAMIPITRQRPPLISKGKIKSPT